jgi:hypothetical protein
MATFEFSDVQFPIQKKIMLNYIKSSIWCDTSKMSDDDKIETFSEDFEYSQTVSDTYVSQDLKECLKGTTFYEPQYDNILMTSTSEHNEQYENRYLPPYRNGLLGTIFRAYCKHTPLMLRADDIWTALMVSFGKYVQTHSEEVRHMFVQHQGRKELRLQTGIAELTGYTKEEWELQIDRMITLILENSNKDIMEWMQPSFTTTTPRDKMVTKLIMMSTVKEYFDMHFCCDCGISKVTLLGELSDWENLYTKAQKLNTFGIEVFNKWSKLLLPVLQEFINSYKGQVNEDFWQRICTSTKRGSGGEKTLRGWFLVFSPFNRDGKYVLREEDQIKDDHLYASVADDEIIDCALDVPIVVEELSGKQHQLVFYAGLLTTIHNTRTRYVRPSTDWILVKKKEITREDVYKFVTDNYGKYSYGKKMEEKYLPLVTFTYDIAIEAHVPNDQIIELMSKIMRTISDLAYNKTDVTVTVYENIVKQLSETNKYYQNKFAKYFNVSMMEFLIKTCVK